MPWDEDSWIWDSVVMTAQQQDDEQSSPMPARRMPRESQTSSGTAMPPPIKQPARRSKMGVKARVGPAFPPGAERAYSMTCRQPGTLCQTDHCQTDVSKLNKYNQRYKICYTCVKEPLVSVEGRTVRHPHALLILALRHGVRYDYETSQCAERRNCESIVVSPSRAGLCIGFASGRQ